MPVQYCYRSKPGRARGELVALGEVVGDDHAAVVVAVLLAVGPLQGDVEVEQRAAGRGADEGGLEVHEHELAVLGRLVELVVHQDLGGGVRHHAGQGGLVVTHGRGLPQCKSNLMV